jgi:hypothetical protein
MEICKHEPKGLKYTHNIETTQNRKSNKTHSELERMSMIRISNDT